MPEHGTHEEAETDDVEQRFRQLESKVEELSKVNGKIEEDSRKENDQESSNVTRRGALGVLGGGALFGLAGSANAQSVNNNQGGRGKGKPSNAHITPDALITRGENDKIYAYKENGVVESDTEFVPVLNAAIEFVLDRNGYLYVDAGEYEIKEEPNKIEMSERNAEIFKLQGAGRGTHMYSTKAFKTFDILDGKCSFSDFYLQHRGEDRGPDGNLADGIRISDERYRFGDDQSVTESRLTNLWVDGHFTPIYSAGNNTILHNIKATNAGDNNISLSGQSDYIHMSNIFAYNSTEAGIELDTSASQINLTNVYTRNSGGGELGLETAGIQVDSQQGEGADIAAAREININNLITEEDGYGIIILGGDGINISNHISYPFSDEGENLYALRIDNKGGFSPQTVNVSSFAYGRPNNRYQEAIANDANTGRVHLENGVVYADRGLNLDLESGFSSDDGAEVGLYQVRFNCTERAITREFGENESGPSPSFQASDILLAGSTDVGILLRGENLDVQMNNIRILDEGSTVRLDCPRIQLSNLLSESSDLEILQGKEHHLSNIDTQTATIQSAVTDARIDNHTINEINDRGNRTTIDDLGENAGNPNQSGAWNGHGEKGVIVEDTQNQGDAYLWLPDADAWTSISNGGGGGGGG